MMGGLAFTTNELVVPVGTAVCGFIRIRHCGGDDALSKYIRVDSFESTGWANSVERVIKVVG